MPDLIRHPEHIEFSGFRLLDRVQDKLRRNDGKGNVSTFYESIIKENGLFWCGCHTLLIRHNCRMAFNYSTILANLLTQSKKILC